MVRKAGEQMVARARNSAIQDAADRVAAFIDTQPYLRLAARPGLWLALVCALGLGLRFLLLERESVWLDETYSLGFARLPLGRLWWEPLDVHPPTYYSLLHVVLNFGDSPWLLRMPSALGGALAVPLVYVLGKRVAGAWVGLGAALLLATSSIQILYSQEARSYALLTAAALIVAIGFAGLFGRSDLDRRAIIAGSACYCVGAILALYLHYIAVLLMAAVFALGTYAVARERSAPLTKAWAIANALILTAWLWWLPVILGQLRRGVPQIGWLPPPGPTTIVGDLRALYGERFVSWGWQGFEAMLIAGALIGAWVAVRQRGVVGLLLAAAAFGLPALEIALSWAVKPVFMERSIVWLMPFFLLLVTIGLMPLPRTLRIAGFVLVLAMQLLGTVSYFRTEHNVPWSRLVADVRAGLCPGDLMVVAPGHLQLPIDYAIRNDPLAATVFDVRGDTGDVLVRGEPVDATFARLRAAIATAPPIWVIADERFIGPWFDPALAALMGDYALVERGDFRGVTLSHYVAGDPASAPRCAPGR
jgi:mannosyltransferase